jgi:hypothetical protein
MLEFINETPLRRQVHLTVTFLGVDAWQRDVYLDGLKEVFRQTRMSG